MNVKRAIQVGRNLSDIFNLPCVYQIVKSEDTGGIEVWIYLRYLRHEEEKRREYSFIAHIGDWLCEDDDGLWRVLSDDEYEQQERAL